MSTIYNQIGTGYNATRRADSRIVDRLVELMGLPSGSRVLDVGAGTGSYSKALADRGYEMTALEPSSVMREQADESLAISWVAGCAESLSFADGSFDGVILILCIHHFSDLSIAFSEIRRVVSSGPVVIFTYDPNATMGPWLFDYFPVFRERIRSSFPSVEYVRDCFDQDDSFHVESFPLPYDIADGFAGAAWRYPERYLNRVFRDGTSAFRQLEASLCERGVSALANDLRDGSWDSRYGDIRSRTEYDHGYTFLISNSEQGVAS